MKLLTLPAEHLLVNLLAISICLGILTSCVLRINITHAPLRLELMQVALVCFAVWALHETRDLWQGSTLTLCDAAIGVGLSCYLLSSSKRWQESERKGCMQGQRNTQARLRPLSTIKMCQDDPVHAYMREVGRASSRHH